MKSRSFAILPANVSPLKANQFLGLPPNLTGGEDQRQPRGFASFLVIEDTPDGFFFIAMTKTVSALETLGTPTRKRRKNRPTMSTETESRAGLIFRKVWMTSLNSPWLI